ncbi:MAG: hypothetical protein K2Q18_02670 [Bdellovibrionales bacterium]|nr:hypothetical protein [Bdellovibrionales bacterium]
MYFKIAQSLILISLFSCTTYSAKKIDIKVKEMLVINRAQYVIIEIFPNQKLDLNLEANLVFQNESVFPVKLLKNLNNNSYEIQASVPFTFNRASTLLLFTDSQGEIYRLSLK